MKRALAIAALTFGGCSALWAQPAPQAFPMDKPHKAISISGFDVQNKGMSLVVTKSADDDLRGSGSAGCNNWTATVILRDDQIDFTQIATTKKMCGKPVMSAEDAFLTSLRSARHWRTDGEKLIIEGDAARLMLKPGIAPVKPKAPAKVQPGRRER